MDQRMSDQFPPGFTLSHTLRQHEDVITRIAWSPDGHLLASPSVDKTVCLWNAKTGQRLRILRGHSNRVNAVAWYPDSTLIASGSFDHTIRIWDVQSGQLLRTLKGHSGWVNSVSWSPIGRLIASGSQDATMRLWDVQTGEPLQIVSQELTTINHLVWSSDGQELAFACSGDSTLQLWNAQTGQLVPMKTLRSHEASVYGLAWFSIEESALASSSIDNTIRIWQTSTGREIRVLEGHTNTVNSVSFTKDGCFLASKSCDGTIRIWRTSTWETVAILSEPSSGHSTPGLAFHPTDPVLATLGEMDTVIRIWQLDLNTLHRLSPITTTVHYTNAKVALVGDSGVGKSALGLVLSHQGFIPTESTHGRRVWMFSRRENKLPDGQKEMRETLLWDLAGQPGYRLIHQLHLGEVAVALIVFDAHSEMDPFMGISYWVRALRTAQRVKGDVASMKMFLVLARIDRGGKRVSRDRIDELVKNLGFDGYYETSAREGTNIAILAEDIEEAIDWDHLPKVTSNQVFREIRSFLITEKEMGRILSTIEDLYRTFLSTRDSMGENKDFSAEFATGIKLLEATGLIRQLSFGNLILLQPELLDAYASALVNAIRDEPDGLGSISEEIVQTAAFPLPEDGRISNPEQEKLLLIAMVKDLLFYEIALREQGEEWPYLIFPSESTRENPDLPNPENASVIFTFEGPVLNIYTTLAIRLSHSDLFKKKELWKNAIVYTTKLGGICGLWLKFVEDGKGELTLFFDAQTSQETRFHFEEYVRVHLERKALPESIKLRRIFRCNCGFTAPDQLVRMRTERGFNWFNCPVCETRVDMRDYREQLGSISPSMIPAIDRSADSQRTHAAAQSTLQGKQETNDFDVFLCYNTADRPAVIHIGERLKERGILPWLDVWELRPGLPWLPALEKQIKQIKAAAVFVGKNGVAPWQRQQIQSLLREFVERECPVIPVLLAEVAEDEEPELPLFLKNNVWVDFRAQTSSQDLEPMEQLIWGITGKRKSF